MTDTTQTAWPVDDSPVLVTVRRDRDDIFAPIPPLIAARESGAWPTVRGTVAQFGDFEAQAITRYAEVKQALKHENSYMGPDASNSPPGSLGAQPGFFVFRNGEEHRRLRKLVASYFTVRNIARLRPRIEEITEELLDAMEASGNEGDLVAGFGFMLPTQMICEILGVPFEDRESFGRWTGLIADRGVEPAVGLAAVTSIKEYIARLVAEFRQSKPDNLIGTLIAEHGDEITDDELVGIAMICLIAGHETTAGMIAFGTLALLQHPEQAEMVRTDPEIARPAVEELLRYVSVAQTHYRRMVGPVEVGTRVAQEGDRLLVSLVSANFDPELVGENPGLDITRRPVPHVAFSFGAHQCIGQHLARLELTIALPALLRRFPDLRVTVEPRELHLRENSTVRLIESLPVAW